MTTQENIQIAESLGIRQSMFHRVEDYHDVVNIIVKLEVGRAQFALYFAKYAEGERNKRLANRKTLEHLMRIFKATIE